MKNYVYLFLLLITGSGCAITPKVHRDGFPPESVSPIDVHNRAIVAFLQHPTAVQISCSWLVEAGGKASTRTNQVTVVARDEIQHLFRCMTTDDRSTGLTNHGCAGHMKFRFQFDGKEQEISFDHGLGIKSTLMPGAGFRNLPKADCEDLIRLLKGYGFTESNMGIAE